MADIQLPVGPGELLLYFEGVNREYPGEHWANGVEMCRRWLQLISNEATQSDIDQFASRLDSEKNHGTGWLDLGMQFRHWARVQGFVA